MNDGKCMPCSRRKGAYEFSGLWRPQDDTNVPFPYGIAGTPEGWDPKSEALAAFAIGHGTKYVEWGIEFLSQYLDAAKLGLQDASVFEAQFLNGEAGFDIIFELPGDNMGLWSVGFIRLDAPPGKEPYWPVKLSRRER